MAQKQENRFSDSSPYSFQLGCLSFSRNHGNQQRMLVLQTGLQLAGKTISSYSNVLRDQPCEHCPVTERKWETSEESLDVVCVKISPSPQHINNSSRRQCLA